MALKGSKNCKVNSISTKPYEVDYVEDVINKLSGKNGLSKEEWYKYTKLENPSPYLRRLVYYGVAIHVATDGIAHNTFVKNSSGEWTQIIHTPKLHPAADQAEYSKALGYTNCKHISEAFSDRYNYAIDITYRILRAEKAMEDGKKVGHQISYSTFIPESGKLRDTLMKHKYFKIQNLKPHSYRGNGGKINSKSDNEFLSAYSKYTKPGDK